MTRELITFFAFACAWSWGFWSLGVAQTGAKIISAPEFFAYLWIGSCGPTVAALVSAWVFGRMPAVTELINGLVKIKAGWRVYLVALFLMPLVFLLGFFALGAIPTTGYGLMAATLVAAAPINGLATALFGPGPLGEELGWRGFALTRLLKRHRPSTASVILGLAWTLWHTPLLMFPDWRNDLSLTQFALLYPLSIIALSFLMTAIWIRSGGSVLLAIWAHGVVNFSASVIANPSLWNHAGLSALSVFSCVVGLMAVTAIIAWRALLTRDL